MSVRAVPEARIKSLMVYEMFNCPAEEKWLRRHMIEKAGMEIAAKLFEFNKVLIKECKNGCVLFLKIEVIVPEGPPNE